LTIALAPFDGADVDRACGADVVPAARFGDPRAPCGASVTISGLNGRRVTVSERLTCGRRCIRFTFPIRCGECMSDL